MLTRGQSHNRSRLFGIRPAILESRIVPNAVAVGGEISVNTFTTGLQDKSAIAMDEDGDFVVVWRSYEEPFGGIYGQRFNRLGLPQGGEFHINTFTTSAQDDPAVAMDAVGNFLVVWESFQDGSGFGIYGQRYAADGSTVGGEFRINTTTDQNQLNPSVAMDAAGNAVVAWQGFGQPGGAGYDIYFQRFVPAGIAVGVETRANATTTSNQNNASVAMDEDGDFVIAWDGFVMSGSLFGLGAQRFASSGTALGSPIIVSFSEANTALPSVAVDADGDFAIAWENFGFDGFGKGVYARRYTSAGTAFGPSFPVNSFTSNDQSQPAVAMDSDGNLVVTWTSVFQDSPTTTGIFGRCYDPTGTPIGGEFLVNIVNTSGNQTTPAVALDADGDITVAWQSDHFIGTGGSNNIFSQRFVPTVRVDAIIVNGGADQRSRVATVDVYFNCMVTVGTGAFTLTRVMGGNVGSIAVMTSDVDGRTVASLTFSGAETQFGSLVDGRYTLTIDDATVTHATAGMLDGDDDGMAGGDFVEVGAPGVLPGLFRLFGDADGSGVVTAADFAAFRLAYGLMGPSIFDFNDDGQVTAGDFNDFRLRYGVMV